MKELTKKLQELIDNEAAKVVESNTKYERLFKSIIEELENEINEWKEIKKDYTEGNLTINSIEAEGYIRALITMKNRFLFYEENH